MNPFKTQVGGDHYKQYVIQPYEFFYRNNIPHHKAAIIRRILRFDHPTGNGIQDLDKIQHEIELIKELWNPSETSIIDVSSNEEEQDEITPNPARVERPVPGDEIYPSRYVPREKTKRPTIPTSKDIEEWAEAVKNFQHPAETPNVKS